MTDVQSTKWYLSGGIGMNMIDEIMDVLSTWIDASEDDDDVMSVSGTMSALQKLILVPSTTTRCCPFATNVRKSFILEPRLNFNVLFDHVVAESRASMFAASGGYTYNAYGGTLSSCNCQTR